MKRIFQVLALVVAAMLFINADTSGSGSTSGGAIAQAYSDHYRIFFEGNEQNAQVFASKMEACLELYNSVLHFDLAKVNVKLKVRSFATKAGFDSYLQSVVKETKDDFVYIHYSDLGKCELVVFQKASESDFHTALLHQGFVQFIKAFVPNPPLWLQEGLAAYFEQSSFNAEKTKFNLPEDLIWLTSLKKIVKGNADQPLIAFDSFLSLDKTSVQMQLNTFYPEAWGVIYYLLHSQDRNVNRILWDSIAALDPTLNVMENSNRVKEKAFSWYGIAKLENEFKNFVLNLKTLSDLVAEGVTYYSNNDLDKSKESFTMAMQRSVDNYIPYYYLGLISYNKKDYANAEALYLQAKNRKAPPALINYAMGVNAYADNNYNKAATFLKDAKTLDPKNYGDKVDQIMANIDSDVIVPKTSPSPAPTVSPSPSPKPSVTPAPSPAPSPSPTPSPSVSPKPTPSVTPSPSPSP